MSNSPAWLPFNVADYLKDTSHLTVAEHGAYLMLILHYWTNRGLPADEGMVRRIAHMSVEQWAESRDALAALFRDGWTHKRIDEELAKADSLVEKRRNNARTQHEGRTSGADAVHVQGTSSDTRVPTSTKNPDTSSLRSDVGAPAKKPSPRERLEMVLDAEHAEAVLEHRQRLRKALTEHAAKGLAEQLSKFPDPNAAADRMILKGWASIEPGWGDGPPSRAGPQKPPNLKQVLAASGNSHDDPEPVETTFRYLPAPAGR